MSGQNKYSHTILIWRQGVEYDDRRKTLIAGARSMRGNPYDAYTLAKALEQAAILSGVSPEAAIVDRGYKGVATKGVKLYHPS
jgi:IS5 family transposase